MPSCRTMSLALVVIAISACRGGEPLRRSLPDHVITIVASDTHYDAPDTVLAGLTTIRLVTRGEEPHQAALLRITGGKSYADFLLAIRQPGPPPAWVSVAGGVNAPRIDGATEATLPLEAGTYAILSFLPTRDGYPQLAKGLRRELTVVASASGGAEPTATDTLIATDYAYTNSAPIGAGQHTFRFENRGPQAHEVALFRLATGHSAADMISWIAAQRGDPPGEPLGGIYALRAGEHGWFTVQLIPAEYAFICFLPDEHDGRPHHAHGQIREFRVR